MKKRKKEKKGRRKRKKENEKKKKKKRKIHKDNPFLKDCSCCTCKYNVFSILN